MAETATGADPGSLTVPLLTGWELVVAGLVLLVLFVVAVSVIGMARRARSGHAEWQAWLDARRPRTDGGDPWA